MHDLNPKNLHINGLFFYKIRKKTIFVVLLGVIPIIKFFQKIQLHQVFSLKAPNTIRSFRKSYK